MGEVPNKDFYKINEICRYTDTQPYVLRFWESEFPQLSPEVRGSVRVYSRADIDLVQRIKHLLYDEEYTLSDARAKLEEERDGNKPKKARSPEATPEFPRPVTARDQPAARVEARPAPEAAPEPEAPPAFEERRPQATRATLDSDTVTRGRYEDAIDEIQHLRLQIKEAERRVRRAEDLTHEAQTVAESSQNKAEAAAERIQSLLDSLS